MNANSSMTVSEWLKASEGQLADAGISTAHLDCLVLLEDTIGKDRSWLLSHPEFEVQGSEIDMLNTEITQRAKHIPLAYIRGKGEFYGREFMVNEHTLVPRPETETMIELLKELDLQPGTCLLDVGTGSGCIGITAALELPDAFVQACDIDLSCIEIAEQNADKLGADVHVFESDLLSNVSACDVLLCNLPYVPDEFTINTAATHEPRHAIFGGADGLDLYRTMFRQIPANAWKPCYILTESLPTHHKALAAIAKVAGFNLTKTDDFIQLFETA